MIVKAPYFSLLLKAVQFIRDLSKVARAKLAAVLSTDGAGRVVVASRVKDVKRCFKVDPDSQA